MFIIIIISSYEHAPENDKYTYKSRKYAIDISEYILRFTKHWSVHDNPASLPSIKKSGGIYHPLGVKVSHLSLIWVNDEDTSPPPPPGRIYYNDCRLYMIQVMITILPSKHKTFV